MNVTFSTYYICFAHSDGRYIGMSTLKLQGEAEGRPRFLYGVGRPTRINSSARLLLKTN